MCVCVCVSVCVWYVSDLGIYSHMHTDLSRYNKKKKQKKKQKKTKQKQNILLFEKKEKNKKKFFSCFCPVKIVVINFSGLVDDVSTSVTN